MTIYTLLIIIIVASFTTGIITTFFEKKERKLQSSSSSSESSSSVKKEQTQMIEILSETLEMSSLTKQVDQISLDSNIENEYFEEPVIIKVLDEDTSKAK